MAAIISGTLAVATVLMGSITHALLLFIITLLFHQEFKREPKEKRHAKTA